MSKRFEDDIHYGLAPPDVNAEVLDSLFFDEGPQQSSAKRNVKSVTFGMPAEMYQAAQDLIHHPNLAFQGSLSALLRHALATTIEGLEEFLAEDNRTLYRAFMRSQRRWARERIIITIEELIDQHVEVVRFWMAKGKWDMVIKDISQFVTDVEDYPEPEWREHASKVWLSHPGIRAMLKTLQESMKEESGKNWKALLRLTGRLEVMTGG